MEVECIQYEFKLHPYGSIISSIWSEWLDLEDYGWKLYQVESCLNYGI